MSMKAYFLAGLAFEEAKEKRDRAGTRLRERAMQVCPEELAALDKAKDEVTTAEKHYADVLKNMMKGEMEAQARAWAAEHAATCDNPDCEIRAALNREAAQTAKLN